MPRGTTAFWSRLAALAAPWLLAPVLTACSPRTRPSTFPRGSAASPESPETPVAKVGVALQGDPPLPGEPADDWPGLGAPAPAGPHDHHHHHHEPEGDPKTPPAIPEGHDAR